MRINVQALKDRGIIVRDEFGESIQCDSIHFEFNGTSDLFVGIKNMIKDTTGLDDYDVEHIADKTVVETQKHLVLQAMD